MVVQTRRKTPEQPRIAGPGNPRKRSQVNGRQKKEHCRRYCAAQRHAHAPAPAARPAPAAPAADGAAAAVWAALTANPGTTAAQIAAATGTSRIAAGREPAALETSGKATRTPGARTGRTTAPATWLPAGTAAAAPVASADGDGNLPAPCDSPAPGEADASPPDTGASAATGPAAPATEETAQPPADSGAPRDDAAQDEDSIGGNTTDGPAPDGGTTVPAPADGQPQSPPGDAARLLRDAASAATQAAEVLDAGDTTAALAAADTLCATAASSRRLLKAAISGRTPRGAASPAARPGQLRDLVAAHLAEHPDADFSPHAIGRVLGRSSGAVANALDRLTALSQAQLTSDKPRRYRHQATASSQPRAGTT